MSNVILDACKNALLDSAVAAGLLTTPFFSLTTTLGQAGTEVTGGAPAYARKSFVWTAAAAGQKQGPTVAQVFDIPAGTTVRAVHVFDASTAGTEKCWAPAGGLARRAFTCNAAGVTANTVDSPGHGLVAGDSVCVWATIGAVLPAPLAEDTQYFVIAAGLTTDVFSISTTLGGSAIDITAIGDGDVQKFVPEVYGAQGTYTIPINGFTVAFPG